MDTGLMDEIRVNTVCAPDDLYTKEHVIRESGDRWKNGAVEGMGVGITVFLSLVFSRQHHVSPCVPSSKR
jgi:hypothetical protein